MSMSMKAIGFRPPDHEWHAMKKVYDACTAAGVGVPHEVERFFNDERPDESGVVIDLSGPPVGHSCCKSYNADMRQGLEIDLTKLPSDIKIIRFYCSW